MDALRAAVHLAPAMEVPARLITRGRAVELARQLPGVPVRHPAHPRDPGLPGPGLVLRLPGRQSPGQDADVVPFLGPRPRQGAAEESAAAGDDDSHGGVLDVWGPREVCATGAL